MSDAHPELVTTPRVDNLAHVSVGLVSGVGKSFNIDESLENAITALLRHMLDAGADAVVSVIISTTVAADTITHITILTGTAVRLPWPHGSATPELLAENPAP